MAGSQSRAASFRAGCRRAAGSMAMITVSTIEACHRRRSRPSAASGISHAMYQGSSDAAVTSSASAAQPAAAIQSISPRHTRHSSQHVAAANSPPRTRRRRLADVAEPEARPDEAGDALPVALALDLLDRRREVERTGPEQHEREHGQRARRPRPAPIRISRRRARTCARARPASANGSIRPAVTLTAAPRTIEPAPSRPRRWSSSTIAGDHRHAASAGRCGPRRRRRRRSAG